MTDTFHARLPTLADADLRRILEHSSDYRTDAVEAALVELGRRGHPVSEDEGARIRASLARRDADRAASGWEHADLLGTGRASRLARIRGITSLLLAGGLGSAVALYLTAPPRRPNPLGYEPEDTKRYLRDLELYGGKANVLATEFRRWFDGLWQGRKLAYTVATLTVLLAFGFWFLATRSLPETEVEPEA
ncbi:hypothetical protein GETHOR_04860 [Geothrix oryzae]|uniref:DUF1707 domain-containing protein n=1 Tax=Geothrix oryzae TaxID=2927975 RepID=A0ABM8DN68_9BACT|nr:hypothetical protein [Geothrix oryzae]BDU68385.1 hypothetical protein GETHOR_04860 [Geothrix oryzae]